MARATDSPSDVLPTPGGPDQREDQAAAAPRGLVRVVEPAIGAQLAHREVLDDAVLHVAQTGVVRVEDARGPR